MPRTIRPIVLRTAGLSGPPLAAVALSLSAALAGCAGGGQAKPAAGGSSSSSGVTAGTVFPANGGAAAQVGGGAASGDGTAAVNVEESLPRNKLAALNEADKLINEGEDEKTMGTALKNGGKEKEGDDLVKTGEAKIAKGNELKAKAASMTD